VIFTQNLAGPNRLQACLSSHLCPRRCQSRSATARCEIGCPDCDHRIQWHTVIAGAPRVRGPLLVSRDATALMLMQVLFNPVLAVAVATNLTSNDTAAGGNAVEPQLPRGRLSSSMAAATPTSFVLDNLNLATSEQLQSVSSALLVETPPAPATTEVGQVDEAHRDHSQSLTASRLLHELVSARQPCAELLFLQLPASCSYLVCTPTLDRNQHWSFRYGRLLLASATSKRCGRCSSTHKALTCHTLACAPGAISESVQMGAHCRHPPPRRLPCQARLPRTPPGRLCPHQTSRPRLPQLMHLPWFVSFQYIATSRGTKDGVRQLLHGTSVLLRSET
jgi:hypothetical protein